MIKYVEKCADIVFHVFKDKINAIKFKHIDPHNQLIFEQTTNYMTNHNIPHIIYNI